MKNSIVSQGILSQVVQVMRSLSYVLSNHSNPPLSNTYSFSANQPGDSGVGASVGSCANVSSSTAAGGATLKVSHCSLNLRRKMIDGLRKGVTKFTLTENGPSIQIRLADMLQT